MDDVQIKRLVLQLMAACAWADGKLDPEEDRALRRSLEEHAPNAEPDLMRALLKPRRFDEIIDEFPPEARSQVFGYELLRRCYRIAHSKGKVEPDEMAFLYRCGKTYRFDPDFVECLLVEQAE